MRMMSTTPLPNSNANSNIILSDAPLLSILQQSHPTISSVQIDKTIVQANAEGVCVTVDHDHPNDNASSIDDDAEQEQLDKQLFVKRIQASQYSHKPWSNLRRTLLYVRTEVRFYNEFLPTLRTKIASNNQEQVQWQIAPNCHTGDCHLDGLIDEDESTNAKPGASHNDPSYSEDDSTILEGKGGYLVLDFITPHKEGLESETETQMNNNDCCKYIQTSPLSLKQAKQSLSALARLHASSYEDQDLLLKASKRLCEYGGSYHLQNRNPIELKDMVTSWDTFMGAFQSEAPVGFFDRESIQNLGRRMKNMAPHVSEQLSPKYNDDFATIVHGDFKAMNLFLTHDDGDDSSGGSSECGNNNHNCQPLIIDFASAGVGNGMSDVAMHITHAILPSDLANGGEEMLLQTYLAALEEAVLQKSSSASSSSFKYTKEAAVRHYRLGCIDYMRFILGRFWKSASIEAFEKRKDSENSTLINRNIGAAIAFVEKIDMFLQEIEKETQ